MQCQNCKAALGCGCQRRVASNGTPCCTNCLALVERQIQQLSIRPIVPNPQQQAGV